MTKVVNKTKKKVLTKSAIFCDSFLKRATGVMFKTKIDCAYIFPMRSEQKIALHMLFVFIPIDVLFLDSYGKVVEINKNFKPFSLYFPKNRSKTVIELPAGVVDKTKTAVGDVVVF